MSTIDQYLEVINDRLQEENKQGINRADTEQYLQEMSLKYFREYEVEFEKVKEEHRYELALNRIKGFYRCVQDIIEKNKKDTEQYQAALSSFLAAHMFGYRYQIAHLDAFEKENDLAREIISDENIDISVDASRNFFFQAYEQLVTDNCELVELASFIQRFPSILEFSALLLELYVSNEEWAEAESAMQPLNELPLKYWPKSWLWNRCQIKLFRDESVEALRTTEIYMEELEEKLYWYIPSEKEDEEQNQNIHLLRVQLLSFLERPLEAQLELNKYHFIYTPGEGSRKIEQQLRKQLSSKYRDINDEINIKQNSSKQGTNDQNQEIIKQLFPRLKGIAFDTISITPKGESPAIFFNSDIDGKWFFSVQNFAMIFKAFSKENYEIGVTQILEANGLDSSSRKKAEQGFYYQGDGFKIELPEPPDIYLIIITNESVHHANASELRSFDELSRIDVEWINGIDSIYDGNDALSRFKLRDDLKNITLYFNEEDGDYLLIYIPTSNVAKSIIEKLLEANKVKSDFNSVTGVDGWEHLFENDELVIGYLPNYKAVRINHKR